MPAPISTAMELHPLSDGFFGLDGGAMFGIIPRVLWQRANPPDGNNRIRLALRPLLVLTPADRVLIDTGIGRKYGPDFDRMYNVDDSDDLERSLARHGLVPGDISVVVLTHLHFDHAGGATRLDRHGRPVPRFPNARHVVQRDEWHDATHPNRRTRGSYRPDDFLPLEAAGLLELVDGDADLLPGIRLVRTGGHTRGHQIVLVEHEGGTTVYLADLVPTSTHVNVPYIMGFDLQPLVTMEKKEELLGLAAREEWTCCFEHDPDLAFGVIRSDGDRYRVEPLTGKGENR